MSIQQLPTSYGQVIITADFPGTAPEAVFDYWIDADKVTRWWPPQAEIDARTGGEYRLNWPEMNWELYGTFDAMERGRLLEFSWHWKHESHKPVRQVRVEFQSLSEGGTHLTLTHGTYTPDDTEERQSHIDGWLHFLSQLQQTLEAVAE